MWETPAISSYVAIKQAILELNQTKIRDVARVTVIAILRTVMTKVSTHLSAMHSRAQQGHDTNKHRLSTV